MQIYDDDIRIPVRVALKGFGGTFTDSGPVARSPKTFTETQCICIEVLFICFDSSGWVERTGFGSGVCLCAGKKGTL